MKVFGIILPLLIFIIELAVIVFIIWFAVSLIKAQNERNTVLKEISNKLDDLKINKKEE